MELFYNPDLMSEEEIRKTFVARQGLVDEIVSLIERQPDGAGIQHLVIIAPRGMGKTTVLLMIRLTMKDRCLATRWQAVKFPEESYGVYDLADFWIEALNLLAADTGDDELRKRAESLKTEYPDNDDLQEAALALIKDWRRKHEKRLVLLVDNLDMIFEQINDERDNARLRDVLMNDGSIMLIGCAVTFFHEARAYDQPLYNFFKIYDLRNLKFDQMEEMLHRRAEIDEVENFDETLRANRGRLRVLEYFTGGNPRLVLMLYHVVMRSDISEAQRGLEKLLDEVTPYYKAKVESLPPQQRKILDHIARVSGETSEGLTPKQIAEATRLSVNQVSSQLKRLSDLGYVHSDNLRGRSSYYVLSERLYAIWHQMRFGRQARERMRWLIDFLKIWYDIEEKDILNSGVFNKLPSKILEGLIEAGCITEEEMSRAKAIAPASEAAQREAETAAAINMVIAALKAGQSDEALEKSDRAIEIYPDSYVLWFLRGIALADLGRYEEAIASYDQVLKADESHFGDLHALAHLTKFRIRAHQGELDLAKQDWVEALRNAGHLSDERWRSIASTSLISAARAGHLEFVNQLIKESNLEEQLFPLARAIDYLLTGDEALIEKLSPEVRGAVEEISSSLRKHSGQAKQRNTKPKARKSKSNSSRRTRKQLR